MGERNVRKHCIITQGSDLVLPKLGASKEEHVTYWAKYHTIPRNEEEWTAFLVQRIRQRAQIDLKHVPDIKIAKSIRRGRKVLQTLSKISSEAVNDPDLPACFHWDVAKVGEWIADKGFPEVKEMFLLNNISGRRLVEIDANALEQMGMEDIVRIREVTGAIRTILNLHPPNALRAIMRIVPYELYLRRKIKDTAETRQLTFKNFCKQIGFDYEYLLKTNNFNNLVEPYTTVEIKYPRADGTYCPSTSSSEGSSSSGGTLKYCPTVEYVARTITGRDKIISELFESIISHALQRLDELDKESVELSLEFEALFRQTVENLGISAEDEKLNFATSVANDLVDDILRSRDILTDMDLFSQYAYYLEWIQPEIFEEARQIAVEVLEQVLPIATLLAFEELDLVNLVKEAPQLQNYIHSFLDEGSEESLAIAKDRPSVINFLADIKHQLAIGTEARISFDDISSSDTEGQSYSYNYDSQNYDIN